MVLLVALSSVFVVGRQRAALREKAEGVKADLAMLHEAMQRVDKLAAAPSGVPVAFATLQPQLKQNSRLAKSGVDVLGNPFKQLILGKPPAVPKATAAALATVADAAYWKPYPVEESP